MGNIMKFFTLTLMAVFLSACGEDVYYDTRPYGQFDQYMATRLTPEEMKEVISIRQAIDKFSVQTHFNHDDSLRATSQMEDTQSIMTLRTAEELLAIGGDVKRMLSEDAVIYEEVKKLRIEVSQLRKYRDNRKRRLANFERCCKGDQGEAKIKLWQMQQFDDKYLLNKK